MEDIHATRKRAIIAWQIRFGKTSEGEPCLFSHLSLLLSLSLLEKGSTLVLPKVTSEFPRNMRKSFFQFSSQNLGADDVNNVLIFVLHFTDSYSASPLAALPAVVFCCFFRGNFIPRIWLIFTFMFYSLAY